MRATPPYFRLVGRKPGEESFTVDWLGKKYGPWPATMIEELGAIEDLVASLRYHHPEPPPLCRRDPASPSGRWVGPRWQPRRVEAVPLRDDFRGLHKHSGDHR